MVGTMRKGFTIVELLIVIVVIAILAAITIVAYNGIQDRAKHTSMVSFVSQGVKKITAYAAEHSDTYPSDAAEAGLVSSDGVTYEVSSSARGYCLTVKANRMMYFQTSTMSAPSQGTCYGILAWWPLNGDASDASGNGVNATAIGAVSAQGQSGAANGAYQLGETAQYISVGNPSSFSAVPSQFTYSIWLARTGTTAGSQWPVIMGANDTHVGFGMRASGYGASIYFEWGLSPYSGSTFAGSGGNGSLATANEWHHAVATFNGTTLSFYWDGTHRATSGSTVMRTPMLPMTIGSSSSGWIGKVDDARVYGRALSAEEVQAVFQAGAL
jgi:prepilin-type N-terminal cleavage/methylation domain-containing protein